MKNFRKLIIITCCCFLIYAVTGAEIRSVKIKCTVDYHGIFNFSVPLPEGFKSWKHMNPAIYYKRPKQGRWIHETDCDYSNNKNEYSCAMRILTNKDRTLIERIDGYKFKFSLKLNNTIVNITEIVFKDYPNVTVNPWHTLKQVTYCSDSYGVKYIATNASHDNIGVEWIRYPFDVDYSNQFKSRIHIRGPGIDKEDDVDKEKYCQKDVCNFKYFSLKPCAKYAICLKTFDYLNTEHQEKCRDVSTYCNSMNKVAVKWQDTLLCVFGVMILMICVIILWARFNKPTQFSRKFGNIDTQGEIVNQEDLVNPGLPSMNEHMGRDMDASNQQLYKCPYAVIASSEDFNQF